MPLPRFILQGEYLINAKLLYALLLGRTQLSQKSGWVSEDGDVYDRVLEVCVPIQFNGENFRKGNAAENVKRAAKILNQIN